MTYRVVWAAFAENWLEKLFSIAADQKLIAAAANEIDLRLAADPIEFGESRYDAVRIGFVRPLGVLFEVFGDVRTVVVYDVWRVDRQ